MILSYHDHHLTDSPLNKVITGKRQNLPEISWFVGVFVLLVGFVLFCLKALHHMPQLSHSLYEQAKSWAALCWTLKCIKLQSNV